MRPKRVSDAGRRPAPSSERQGPGPAQPAKDSTADRQPPMVCPACENISMIERNGTTVCRHCGYTGPPAES
jgi:ribosomal protein L37AE/L43A